MCCKLIFFVFYTHWNIFFLNSIETKWFYFISDLFGPHHVHGLTLTYPKYVIFHIFATSIHTLEFISDYIILYLFKFSCSGRAEAIINLSGLLIIPIIFVGNNQVKKPETSPDQP